MDLVDSLKEHDTKEAVKNHHPHLKSSANEMLRKSMALVTSKSLKKRLEKKEAQKLKKNKKE